MDSPEACEKTLENRGVNRLDEIHAGREAVGPAYLSLDRLETVELDPKLLVDARPIDELDAATVERRVEDSHSIVELARPAERYGRVQHGALAAACR